MQSHRRRVAEALVLLVAARVLVAAIRFGRWRGSLGDVVCDEPSVPDVGMDRRVPEAAWACARAVSAAAGRVPGTRCLPRAMALQWMLRRRRVAATLVMGILPEGERRGRVDDLHAWIEIGGTPLLDGGNGLHCVVLRLSTRD